MRVSRGFVRACLFVIAALPTLAEVESGAEHEVVLVIGSRFETARSAGDATAPVDVLSAEELARIGNGVDLTDSLRALAPSYNAPTASGDGDTFVRHTSLRGLAPDQTLVMVNGKRRHRSAVIAEFVPAAGKGAHGPSIGMIPAIAVRDVQILRDGAGAQYGSDAIAGVINLTMKEAAEGGEVRISRGRFYAGEHSMNAALNAGFPVGREGFANLSVEYVDNQALSRGRQRPNAQALIDAGVAGVGEDTPFHDAPLVQTWGRGETKDLRAFLNAGVRVAGETDAYLMSNVAATRGRYRFFFRGGDNPATPDVNEAHATIRALGLETDLPTGFTPYFDGDHLDFSAIGGVRGTFGSGTGFDFSASLGQDRIDFFLSNTINESLGLIGRRPAQMDFDVGSLKQREVGVNADFTRRLTTGMRFAFGGEWRDETFTIIAGEPNSYHGVGSSGFRGLEPANAGAFSRANVGAYGEIEHEISQRALAQYALRYERFSDFGGTLNGKLALRLSLGERLALRGSINTGFHAPTPGQSNLQKVTTTFDNDTGAQVESGTVRPTHPSAIAAGGAALRQEESIDYSAGLWFGSERAEITVDAYVIDIDGRIFKTQNLPFADSRGVIRNVQFFTNALDLEVVGLDVVATARIAWGDTGIGTDASLAYSRSETDVVKQTRVRGILPVSAADVEDIERSYPTDRITLAAATALGPRWNLAVRANYYGAHYDERGRIGGVDGNAPTKRLGSTVFVDLEVGYDMNDHLRATLGGVNVLNEYIDVIEPPFANRLDVGLPYARRTAANFEGGSWYVRLAWRW